ncbi:MAG: hypothetical protein ACJ0NM_03675 [Flavobacteriaceae bacterium]
MSTEPSLFLRNPFQCPLLKSKVPNVPSNNLFTFLYLTSGAVFN